MGLARENASPESARKEAVRSVEGFCTAAPAGNKLKVAQSAVFAPQRVQFVVGSLFDDLAVDDHHDAIGMAHGRKSLSDHERGSIFHQPFNRIPNTCSDSESRFEVVLRG
jgi:hypothetical protein